MLCEIKKGHVVASASCALPADVLQTWEKLDANGYVVPAERTASAISLDSEFRCGELLIPQQWIRLSGA